MRMQMNLVKKTEFNRNNGEYYRAQGRYSFQCMSATYYHNENDCVLNLDKRQQIEDQFQKNTQTRYNVSYIGILCSPGTVSVFSTKLMIADYCYQMIFKYL